MMSFHVGKPHILCYYANLKLNIRRWTIIRSGARDAVAAGIG